MHAVHAGKCSHYAAAAVLQLTWVRVSAKVTIREEECCVFCHHALKLFSLGQLNIDVRNRKGPEIVHVCAIERRIACRVCDRSA